MMRFIKLILCCTSLLLVSACVSLATSGFDKSNTVGRDVDEVIQEIQNKGLSCGKYKHKEFPTNRLIGGVRCSIKESSPLCPKSYRISLSYEFDNNKVSSFFKGERDNCF